jgi:hypothetical protein
MSLAFRYSIILLIFILSFSESLLAKDTNDNCVPCFRGKSLSECSSFFISEFAYLKRLSRSVGFDEDKVYRFKGDHDFYFSADIGWMRNLDMKNAIGGTMYFGLDDDGSRLAIKPRYRRWLNDKISLDISAGLIFKSFENEMHKSPGFTGHIGLGISDYIMLITQLEIMPFEAVYYSYHDGEYLHMKGKEVVWYGGLKLGSYPGIVTIIIAPITAYIIYVVGFKDS